MTQKTAITEVIKTLFEVKSRFNLRRTEDEEFFTEWYGNLPEITDEEKISLDVIRRRYLYHLADGNLTEGTVTLLIGSPLLEKNDGLSCRRPSKSTQSGFSIALA